MRGTDAREESGCDCKLPKKRIGFLSQLEDLVVLIDDKGNGGGNDALKFDHQLIKPLLVPTAGEAGELSQIDNLSERMLTWKAGERGEVEIEKSLSKILKGMECRCPL